MRDKQDSWQLMVKSQAQSQCSLTGQPLTGQLQLQLQLPQCQSNRCSFRQLNPAKQLLSQMCQSGLWSMLISMVCYNCQQLSTWGTCNLKRFWQIDKWHSLMTSAVPQCLQSNTFLHFFQSQFSGGSVQGCVQYRHL